MSFDATIELYKTMSYHPCERLKEFNKFSKTMPENHSKKVALVAAHLSKKCEESKQAALAVKREKDWAETELYHYESEESKKRFRETFGLDHQGY
ncbi:MAG: hypothetical protein K1060chlam5_01175 [Candidatus Anoxychlamydiales bacterium]|nr:hypothetical protein [Candidatus Anoxychlamydiales bacterium]